MNSFRDPNLERLLDELGIPPAERDRFYAADASLAEERDRVLRGESSVKQWMPTDPDPFGGSWEWLHVEYSDKLRQWLELTLSTVDDTHLLRELDAALASTEFLGRSDEEFNRSVVDHVQRLLHPEKQSPEEHRRFLDAIGRAMQRRIEERAFASSESPENSATDTIEAKLSAATTIIMAKRQPQVILARMSALTALESVDPLSARIYRLHAKCGRLPGELAILLDMPIENVIRQLSLAISEVLLDG
jgi:hypothetical protein